MGSASELFFKILVAQDGASDQLGENCLESGQIDKVACRQNIAPPDVDQIAYRLEHKEGYADGQQDMSGRDRLQTCRQIGSASGRTRCVSTCRFRWSPEH